MKKMLALLMLFSITLVLNAQQEESKKYAGVWEGKLNVSAGVSLRVILKIVKNNDGTLTGFLDSPDQGASDIQASVVSQTEDSLKFEVKMIGAAYSGKIMKDSMVAVGKFKQGMATLDLNLKKVEKVAIVSRPQLPQKPYPYNEEEATFENQEAGITLAGTLTYPEGEGKFPAVVMVTGSGGQDRDETVFGHKPFLVIADYLTRNGIAVLRFDDRGVGKSTGTQTSATSEDFATDALAAVQYLKSRKEIDTKHIGIIGHSEGGIIAPMAAVNSGDVAFIVLLAGTGITGKELIPIQTGLLMKAEGSSEADVEKAVKMTSDVFEIIVLETDKEAALKKLNEYNEKRLASMTEEERKNPENGKEAFNGMIKAFTSDWFRFFLVYDPKDALERVKVPVLALFGGKDLQVPPKYNIPPMEEALKTSGNKNYKVVEIPGLNHVFQTANTGGVSEYGKIEETFSPAALKIIGDWIKEIIK